MDRNRKLYRLEPEPKNVSLLFHRRGPRWVRTRLSRRISGGVTRRSSLKAQKFSKHSAVAVALGGFFTRLSKLVAAGPLAAVPNVLRGSLSPPLVRASIPLRLALHLHCLHVPLSSGLKRGDQSQGHLRLARMHPLRRKTGLLTVLCVLGHMPAGRRRAGQSQLGRPRGAVRPASCAKDKGQLGTLFAEVRGVQGVRAVRQAGRRKQPQALPAGGPLVAA